MRHLFPPEDGPLDDSWLAPLRLVHEQIRTRWRYRFFDLDDFMIMSRIVRPPRPGIVLYKHHFTRRYVNLDDAANPYRFVATPNSRSVGRYLPHHSLDEALDDLRLWELPWMKRSLEAHTRGLSWEDSWQLRNDPMDPEQQIDLEPVDDRGWSGGTWSSGGAGRGHLRVV